MAEKVPGWLERVLLPQISELKGEFKAVHSAIKRLDQKIDWIGDRLDQKIDGLDEKLAQRIEGVEKRIDALDNKFDVTQRLAKVEAKVQELEFRR